MNKRLIQYDLMEVQQREAKEGCSGTVDNLLIDRTVTLDCHNQKHTLSMGSIDLCKAYDSISHVWLKKMGDCVKWLASYVEAGIPRFYRIP